jgi:hypothetical protein
VLGGVFLEKLSFAAPYCFLCIPLVDELRLNNFFLQNIFVIWF